MVGSRILRNIVRCLSGERRPRRESRRQAVIRDVKNAYYDILKAQNELTSSEASISLFRDLDQLVDRYYQEQNVLNYEILEVKSRRARAEHDAFRERNLLGREIDTRYSMATVGVDQLAVPALSAAESAAIEQQPAASSAEQTSC